MCVFVMHHGQRSNISLLQAHTTTSATQITVRQRSDRDIAGLRRACVLARHVLDAAHAAIAPGVTTDAIDEVVHRETVTGGAYPSPLNYYHFPKSCCTSVNEVWCMYTKRYV